MGGALLVVSTTAGLVALASVIGWLDGEAETATSIRRRRGRAEQVVTGLATGVVVTVVSGWIAPGVVIGAAAWYAVGAWRRRCAPSANEIERIEALASWIENLRDVLLAGEQPIGAITATVTTCPTTIRAPVRRLVAGLGRHDPDVVFRRFADELDDPIGDLVSIGLLVAVRRGARTVAVLSAVAEQARQHADRRRLVEAERAPATREVDALTLVMTALVAALFVFGRSELLRAYDAWPGQLFLATAIAVYAGLLARVRRLARFPRPARFLTLSGAPS